MWPERSSWKELDAKETIRYWLARCQSMPSVPGGGRQRKAQASPMSGVARCEAGYSGVLQKVGARGENVEEKNGSDKEVQSHTLSVKANGIEATSV